MSGRSFGVYAGRNVDSSVGECASACGQPFFFESGSPSVLAERAGLSNVRKFDGTTCVDGSEEEEVLRQMRVTAHRGNWITKVSRMTMSIGTRSRSRVVSGLHNSPCLYSAFCWRLGLTETEFYHIIDLDS